MYQIVPPTTRRGARGPAPIDRVNLRDVARFAGVSPATASRVFSGTTSVREETRTKVLQAADHLGYVVNSLAQAVVGARHRSLAVVARSLEEPFVAQIVSGAEGVTRLSDTPFSLALTHSDQDVEQQVIRTLTEQRVAAVLLTGSTRPGKDSEDRIARYADHLASVQAKLILCAHPHIPTVPGVRTVTCDNPGGVRTLVQHLVGKGHRRIAFLGWSDTTTANQRFLGYSLGLRDAKLPLEASLVVECADDVVGGHLAALLLLKKPNPPTAIVAINDAVAVGVYRAARDIRAGSASNFYLI